MINMTKQFLVNTGLRVNKTIDNALYIDSNQSVSCQQFLCLHVLNSKVNFPS